MLILAKAIIYTRKEDHKSRQLFYSILFIVITDA